MRPCVGKSGEPRSLCPAELLLSQDLRLAEKPGAGPPGGGQPFLRAVHLC